MKTLTVFLFILLTPCIYSQSEYPGNAVLPKHMPGDIILSASPNILIHTPMGVQFAGGAKIQFFLGKHFSLDADLVLGKNYFHMSPGLIGVPVGLLGMTVGFDNTSELTSFLVSLVGLALSFEHFSGHFPVRENLEISPYVSLLRMKSYNAGREDVDYFDPELKMINDQLFFATGIQVNRYFGNFALSPYAEYSIGYRDHRHVIGFGVYCGITFNTKLLNRMKEGTDL
jgi:hypothetical protein